MHTIVNLGNSNCSWCLNAMVEDLRASPRVGAVRVNATASCLEVDHDFEDPIGVIAVMNEDLRGSMQASNDEAVLVGS